MNMKNNQAVQQNKNLKKREPAGATLIYNLRGVLSILLLYTNTLFCFSFLVPIAVLKLMVPIRGWRKFCGLLLNGIAVSWISVNNFKMSWSQRITWDVRGMEGLSLKKWYLVISNHQTWVDIVVLQRVFNRRIPFLKFFLKKGAHLGPDTRHCMVGARFSVHEAILGRVFESIRVSGARILK